MKALDLIQKETIMLELDVNTKEACLEKMAVQLKNNGYLSDSAVFIEDVHKREEHGSTGVGFGIAIPHGKSIGVSKPGLAFARVKQPIEWKSLDDKPVQIIILLAIPQEHVGNEHIRILAAVSRQLIHEQFRDQLLHAKTEEEILNVFDFEA